MEPSFYETFSIETAARLRAHDQWMEAHEARMQAHEETLRDMRAQHDDQMRGIRQIMSHIATHMVEHEGRISQNERTFEEIAATLKAINDKL